MSLWQQAAGNYAGAGRQASLVALVLVNLVPLAGVLLFDWDVAALMVLYWSENLIVGFYTILKMVVRSPVFGWFSSLFFLIHYGGFCGVHGLFIMTLLVDHNFDWAPHGDTWPLFLVFPQILFNVSRGVLAQAPPEWMAGFAALFASHGISFFFNFLRGPERERLNLGNIMNAPYGRMVVLHIAIILGAFGIMALGQPVAMLVVLVLLKMGLDIALHLREHRKAQA